jgi:RNA polymerase sigma factor (sigma-70 family)
MNVAAAQASGLPELVQRASAGDRIAWDELVARYGSLVWAVARAHHLSAADAADVSQTVWLRLVENLDRLRDPQALAGWLRLVENLDRLRDPQALAGWLRATTRHECLRIIRSGARVISQADFDPDEASTDAASPELALLDAERDRQLWSALRALSQRCRSLLAVLAYSPDAGYAEIAGLFGIPVGSIGPTRARCLEHLRRRLEQAGYVRDGAVSREI